MPDLYDAVDHLIEFAKIMQSNCQDCTIEQLTDAFRIAIADGHDSFEMSLAMASIAFSRLQAKRRA